MSEDRKVDSAIGELVDELKLQAWLARKEFSEPSLHDEQTYKEASSLARMRDEIRLQLHLGKLDAADEFEQLERSWRNLMRNDVQPAANSVAADLETAAHDLLKEIRRGYHRLLG